MEEASNAREQEHDDEDILDRNQMALYRDYVNEKDPVKKAEYKQLLVAMRITDEDFERAVAHHHGELREEESNVEDHDNEIDSHDEDHHDEHDIQNDNHHSSDDAAETDDDHVHSHQKYAADQSDMDESFHESDDDAEEEEDYYVDRPFSAHGRYSEYDPNETRPTSVLSNISLSNINLSYAN